MRGAHARPLALKLALAYAAVVIYASLYPVHDWRDTGAPLLDFVLAPWPRWYTGFDLGANVAAYLPLGYLMVAALRGRVKPGWAVIAASLSTALLSLGLEVLQNYLPSRVPSNLDLGSNALGGLLGGLLGARYGRAFGPGGGLARWRLRRVARGAGGDLGLVLLALWLLAQLTPETLLFGTGGLRSALGLPAPLPFSAPVFLLVEASVAALGVVAAGLLGWQLMRERSLWLLGAVFLLALLVRSLSAALLLGEDAWLNWLTRGNLAGLLVGTILLALALVLPQRWQPVTAALALLGGTALVNLAPDNPYLAEALARWHQGHFLNFNGLTRGASVLWPFLALAWLVAWPSQARAPAVRP